MYEIFSFHSEACAGSIYNAKSCRRVIRNAENGTEMGRKKENEENEGNDRGLPLGVTSPSMLIDGKLAKKLIAKAEQEKRVYTQSTSHPQSRLKKKREKNEENEESNTVRSDNSAAFIALPHQTGARLSLHYKTSSMFFQTEF